MAKKSKRRLIKFLIGLLITVIIIGICVGGVAITNLIGNKSNTKLALSFSPVEKEDKLIPVKDEKGFWTFNTDRDFVVLQLTDVHIGAGALSFKKDSMAVNAVADLVHTVKPDLVIVTGDIAYPVPHQSGTFNNISSTKIFAELMENLQIYWAVTLGNHDSEIYSYHSRKEIADFYSNKDINFALNENAHCLFQSGDEDVEGFGNYMINVKNNAGLVTQSFVMLDSHSYTNGDYLGVKWYYDNIKQSQIDWYAENINAIDQQNKAIQPDCEMFKSLAFFHIPLQEHHDAWHEYLNNGMKDTEDVKFKYGKAGETGKIVYCGIGEDQLFETMHELGSTQGIFVGHDHKNNFSIEYKGIRFTYGLSIDYLAYSGIYKETEQRGGTVITVKTDGSFDCYGLRLVDKKIIE